ncbi:phage DNA ejection protein, partial [Candidatus Symbiopectobacterium sp.]|uniref:phage DNA ejection protein n=1 Tax=Candidatus Symbiopectobacterium sp. TaxID=2816440 RepID=UPI0025C12586
GDTSALRDFAVQNPAFIGQAQQAVSGLDAGQRSDMTNQAAKLRLALSQGPDAYAQYLQKNSGELSRVGANPGILAQMGIQDPQGAAQLFDILGMAGSGDKYFDILDKQQGRALEQSQQQVTMRGQDITARGQALDNARGWAAINHSALDRAQRAQFHSDDMGLKLMELGQKGKPTADLIKGLNSDITGFGKNYNAVKSAANSLQALSRVNTGAAQLGIIFNYMKSLDPQSVVREGEQVQVMRSDGVWGQMKGYVDQLNAGNGLSQDARNNIVQAAKINANSMGEQFNQQVDEYLGTYGDTIPQGLKNSLSNRKAKLFENVPGGQGAAGGGTTGNPSTGTIGEGATATNPGTGQKIIFRGGQWQPM